MLASKGTATSVAILLRRSSKRAIAGFTEQQKPKGRAGPEDKKRDRWGEEM